MIEPIELDQVDVELLEMVRLADLAHFRVEREAAEDAGRDLELGGSE